MSDPDDTSRARELTYLVDVDNTLLDNDAVIEHLRNYLQRKLGAHSQQEYWRIFERLRDEIGYADYLGALQQYRLENPRVPEVLGVSLFLLQFPFGEHVYPGALDVIASLRRRAAVAILSDGDAVFQPFKVHQSGLWTATAGHVLIYVHKEKMLDDVERRYPSRRYVMVDDKLRILAAMKATWGARLTTVFVRQGHYATDPSVLNTYPPADVTIERIADLANVAASIEHPPAR
jgi:FMN phosphatase YigB (HAD superfamily)